MATASYSPLDGAVEILANYGFELSNGNFNHAPMVAEALCAMDRPEAVMPWIARYRERILSRAAADKRIARDDWRNALGQRDRFADWALFFADELHDTDWPRVLDCFGGMAGAGVCRRCDAWHYPRRTRSVRTP